MLDHTAIPLPIQGVSQKEDDIKNPLRVKEQINMFCSDTKGLSRRLPFEHVKAFDGEHDYISEYDNDDQFLSKRLGNDTLVMGGGTMTVLKGFFTEQNITFEDSVVESYLQDIADQPILGQAITIGDSFLVLNKNRYVVKQSATTNRTRLGNVWVVNMEYGRTIKVLEDGLFRGEFTIADGTGATDYIQLSPENVISRIKPIIDSAGVTCTILDSDVLSIEEGANITIEDSKGNTLVKYHTGEVEGIEDLPPSSSVGNEVKVNPSTDKDENSAFYVYYTGSVWEETYKSGEQIGIMDNQMPIKISRVNFTTWHAEALEWTVRRIGSEETHPYPDFVETSISQMFTYRGRLGLISGSSISLSRPNDYTDFASLTARDSLDDDPIKLLASSDSTQYFRYSLVVDRYVLLFTSNNVFVMGSGVEAPFTPSTANLSNIYTSSEEYVCPPVVHGESVLTCSGNQKHSQINQLFIDAYGSFVRNPCLTDHVPTYIPSDPYKIVSGSSSNIFFVLTKGGPNTITVCQLKRNTEGSIDQLAWHKWEPGQIALEEQTVRTQRIVTTDVYDDHLYVGFVVNDTWFISKTPLKLDGFKLEDVVYLDHWSTTTTQLVNDSYIQIDGDRFGGCGRLVYMIWDDPNDYLHRYGHNVDERQETVCNRSPIGRVQSTYIFPTTNVAKGEFAIYGIDYESSVNTGRQYPRDKDSNILHYVKMQLRWLNVYLLHSGFHYKVHYDFRPTIEQYKQPRRVAGFTRMNTAKQYYKGVERVLINGDGKSIEIEFLADEHNPLAITSLEASHMNTKRGV